MVGQRWQDALKAAADRCEAVLFGSRPRGLTSSGAWPSSCWRKPCTSESSAARRTGPIGAGPGRDDCRMASASSSARIHSGRSTFQLARSTRPSLSGGGLDLLLRGLERAGLDAKSFQWPPPGDLERAPYRGLRALEPQDAAIFFGRDAAIVRGLDRIRVSLRVASTSSSWCSAPRVRQMLVHACRTVPSPRTRRSNLPVSAGDPAADGRHERQFGPCLLPSPVHSNGWEWRARRAGSRKRSPQTPMASGIFLMSCRVWQGVGLLGCRGSNARSPP